MARRHLLVRFTLILVGLIGTARAELPRPEHPYWKPVADSVYLQESCRQLPLGDGLRTLALYEGRLYLGDRNGVWLFEGQSLQRLDGGPQRDVLRLRVIDGTLWAMGSDGLWRRNASQWVHVSELPIQDLCRHGERLFAAGVGLFVVEGDALKPLVALREDRPPTTLQGLASYAGALYAHDGLHLAILDGEQLNLNDIADWGVLPAGARIRDLLPSGNRLVVATDRGLAVLRGMTWYLVQGEQGLPYEDTTCLAPGFAGDLWIGSVRGAIRNVGQEYQYFGHRRWLPHDHVRAIVCAERVVYLATDNGLAILDYEPYTLAKKAAWYARWLDEWGQKRLGFVHALIWQDGQWLRHVSDNDGGYSVHRLASLAFQYAVTHDEAVRAEAVDMMKSLKWTAEITSIDGFPARAVWAVGEQAVKEQRGSGGLPAEWHPTPDGLWEWKGDTSSDELIAQVYGTMIFLELVANAEERPWAVEHLNRMVGHIVREGFVLRDLDGKPTRWARWDPDYLLTSEGIYERGLNALEAFSFLETTAHFTGDAKYSAAKQQLLQWRYTDHVLRQKITFPAEWFTPFDDRLAFLAYFPLLCYETDPALRAVWLRSLERSWEIKRVEGLPWFAYLYGAATGHDCENERAVAFLREAPLDLRLYSYRNSHRSDLKRVPKGYQVYGERTRPFSPRETALQRWDADYLASDGGAEGQRIADCSGWLEAYWMGRYFSFIEAPTTTDPEVLNVTAHGPPSGAKPYSGLPRPKLRHEQP